LVFKLVKNVGDVFLRHSVVAVVFDIKCLSLVSEAEGKPVAK